MMHQQSNSMSGKRIILFAMSLAMFASSGFATGVKTYANVPLSSKYTSTNVIDNIDQTLIKMESTSSSNWSKLSAGLDDLGKDIEIISQAFVAPSGENLERIMSSLPLFSGNYSNISSRGTGGDLYLKLASELLCTGENINQICQPPASGKALKLNANLRSTTVLSFSSPNRIDTDGYMQNLIGLGGGETLKNRTELPSLLAQSASQSMALQVLSHIVSQNTDKYPTKYSKVSGMLDSFYDSALITGLPSEQNQVSVLKSLTSSALLLTLTQRVIMQQNQTRNSLNAAILAQQAVLEKQNQQMIEQNSQRNRYLRELVVSSKSGRR